MFGIRFVRLSVSIPSDPSLRLTRTRARVLGRALIARASTHPRSLSGSVFRSASRPWNDAFVFVVDFRRQGIAWRYVRLVLVVRWHRIPILSLDPDSPAFFFCFRPCHPSCPCVGSIPSRRTRVRPPPPPFRGIRHDCVPPFRGKDVGPDWVGSSISLRIPPFRKGRMDPFSLGSTPWSGGWIRIQCAKPGGRVHPTPTHEHVHGRLEQVSKGRAGR